MRLKIPWIEHESKDESLEIFESKGMHFVAAKEIFEMSMTRKENVKPTERIGSKWVVESSE